MKRFLSLVLALFASAASAQINSPGVIVFDEASQLGRARSLAFVGLMVSCGISGGQATCTFTAPSVTLSTATATSGLSASLIATDGATLVQGPTYSAGVFTQAIRFGDSSLGTGVVPLTARLGTSATANVFEMQNSAGTNLAYFASTGRLLVPYGSAAAPAFSFAPATAYGIYFDSSYNSVAVSLGGNVYVSLSDTVNSGPTLGSGVPLMWASTATPFSARDLFLRRCGAACLQLGTDANGAATRQKIKAHDGITGSNVAGAGIDFATGIGTGDSTPPSLALQTAVPVASGTSAQSLGDRFEVLGKYTALAEATATSFARVAIASGAAAGGDALVTVEAGDGTDRQVRTLRYVWDATNKAGTITRNFSTPIEGGAVDTGTLTCTITLVDAGSGNLDHKVDCTSSLTQTVLRANAQIARNFAGAITEQ